MKKLIILFSLGLLVLAACRKDNGFTEVEILEEEPIVLVEGHFLGRVVDEEGIGVEDGLLELGDAFLMTDHNGAFEAKALVVQKRGEVLVGKKDFFFDGLFWTNNEAQKTRFVELNLAKKRQTATFPHHLGADLVLDDGSQISFESQTIKDINGQPHIGEVIVKSKWLDPTADESKVFLPNSFIAEGEEGEEMILTSYGLLHLELVSADRIVLELADEKKATIQLPVPAQLTSSAPDNLSFWIFDAEKKKWLKESDAQLQNGFYQGQVSQGGMIAVAESHTPVCVSGKIVEEDLATPNSGGRSAKFYKIELEATNNPFRTWNYTDDEGNFCALVPSGTSVRLKAYDHCQTVVHEKELGSFSADASLSDISLSANTSTSELEIIGDVYDCGVNAPINGRLIIEYPGHVEVHALSHFKPNWKMFTPIKCTDFPTLRITAYNSRQKLQSTPLQYRFASNFSLGLIRTCESPQDYFDYSRSSRAYKNAPALFSVTPDQGEDVLNIIAGQGFGEQVSLSIEDYNGVGSYSDAIALSIIGDPNLEIHNQNAQINITKDDGLYIEAQVELELINIQTGKTSTLSGEFKARKKL